MLLKLELKNNNPYLKSKLKEIIYEEGFKKI